MRRAQLAELERHEGYAPSLNCTITFKRLRVGLHLLSVHNSPQSNLSIEVVPEVSTEYRGITRSEQRPADVVLTNQMLREIRCPGPRKPHLGITFLLREYLAASNCDQAGSKASWNVTSGHSWGRVRKAVKLYSLHYT